MKRSLSRDAAELGGYGRGMDNKMSRTTKHKLDRQPDKRRRRKGKVEAEEDNSLLTQRRIY